MKIVPIAIVVPIRRPLDKSAGTLSVWTQVRESKDDLNGKLEFAGGKVEANETPKQAAVREVLEETGVSLNIGELQAFNIYTHMYESKTVQLHTFIYLDQNERFDPSGYITLGPSWKDDLASKTPAANHQIFSELIKEFGA